jgi:hypothetical protein
VARAEAIYMQALHRAAETAINARSEVREAYTGYRSAYDIARHQRDEIVPLNQRIAEENVLRYNGMLIGVFELLADARTQIASVNASIEALRDFWIAQADLDMALIGKPSLAARPPAPRWRLKPRRRRPLTQSRISNMLSRRNLLGGAGAITAAVLPPRSARWPWRRCPSRSFRPSPTPCRRWCPTPGRPYNPVVTLNGWTLPWRMNNGVKEFHLVAEPVVREMAPASRPTCGATTARARGRRSRWWKATACASSSPTSSASSPASTGTASACPTAWTA